MIDLEFLDVIAVVFFIAFILIGLIFIGYKNHVAEWGSFTINVVDGWIRIYCRYYHHYIYQPIPVSDNGPTLLACNHLSGLDPFLVVAACRHPIRFMIAQEEYERFGLQWLFRAAGCIPVMRSGRVETAFRATLAALGIIKLAKMASVPITALRVEGMRGQGHTVSALLLPSQSRLYVLPELDCVNKTDEDGLTQLALFLSLRG